MIVVVIVVLVVVVDVVAVVVLVVAVVVLVAANVVVVALTDGKIVDEMEMDWSADSVHGFCSVFTQRHAFSLK